MGLTLDCARRLKQGLPMIEDDGTHEDRGRVLQSRMKDVDKRLVAAYKDKKKIQDEIWDWSTEETRRQHVKEWEEREIWPREAKLGAYLNDAKGHRLMVGSQVEFEATAKTPGGIGRVKEITKGSEPFLVISGGPPPAIVVKRKPWTVTDTGAKVERESWLFPPLLPEEYARAG